MDDLVYPRERVLGVFTLLFGLLAWLLLVIGTFGAALLLLVL
ncbi:MAG: peptidase M48, partial [Burkholderiaceae bacterium]